MKAEGFHLLARMGSYQTIDINEHETINYCFECLIISLMMKTCEKLVRAKQGAKISQTTELRAERYIVGLYSETELNTVCQDEGER